MIIRVSSTIGIDQGGKDAVKKRVLRKAALRYLAEAGIEAAIVICFFLVIKLRLQDAGIMTAQQADIFFFAGGLLSFVFWRAIKRRFLHRRFNWVGCV